MKLATQKYKDQVIIYKSTNDKATKKQAEKTILALKQTFSQIANPTDKDYKAWKIVEAKMGEMPLLFSREEQESWKKSLEILAAELQKHKEKYDYKLKTLYAKAFEWRFEFPEVLDENGQFVGFDAIIGNPPYIKEDTNRNAFNGLHHKAVYQGKMDIWYLFGELGLNLLQSNGYLALIATNNWLTNAGAANFRNIILKNSQILSLIDFGAYMVFDNAAIQTMIMIFQNNQEKETYSFDYRKLEGEKCSMKNVLDLLGNVPSDTSFLLDANIDRQTINGKSISFNTDTNIDLLEKIKSKKNFSLIDKSNKRLGIVAEITNGIHHHHDIVNRDRHNVLPIFPVGTGIFVLSNIELVALHLSEKEKEMIKPNYTTKQVKKYFTNPKHENWVIYTKSNISKFDNETKKIPIVDYPAIKAHLDKFHKVITSDNKPYGLHRAREQHFFEGEKIAVVRKCVKEPIFSYSNFNCYLSAAFYIIQSNRIDLKYLTGLLNSKLIAFWLRKKGKMQGNNYQLDKEPLLEVPIYQPNESNSTEILKYKNIAKLVSKIISLKQKGKDSLTQEKEIDSLVYELYNITAEEQKVIEGE